VSLASRPSTRASKIPFTKLVLSLGASPPGRRRACVLFGVFFRGGYSPTGQPGDTVWLAVPPTGWGGMSVSSHAAAGKRGWNRCRRHLSVGAARFAAGAGGW